MLSSPPLRKNSSLLHWVSILLLSSAVACSRSSRGQTPADLPTLAPSISSMSTAMFMTENAPPEGYREQANFERIDQNLQQVEGWRYEVSLEFEGVFSGTTRPATATARAQVWFNQIGVARRVLVESHGELLQQNEGASYEAVQLGADVFLVQNDVCLSEVEEDAQTAANLKASDLVGGAWFAKPSGKRQIINGIEAWEYQFELANMSLPMMRFAGDTRITSLLGEMWVAPSINAVGRYWVTLNIENARLLANDLPVTGQLRLRYDLYDVGILPNITVPFGC